MYHFIAGYTAKVAGTEMGIKEPVSTFSACFGAAFLPRHPTLYAEMLSQKMKEHNANCYLVNTGWSGGSYGDGSRMDIDITRKIIDAIHDGSMENTTFENFSIFDMQIPTHVNGVESHMLHPRKAWADKAKFDATLKHLAGEFNDNFRKYENEAGEEIKSAGPKL